MVLLFIAIVQLITIRQIKQDFLNKRVTIKVEEMSCKLSLFCNLIYNTENSNAETVRNKMCKFKFISRPIEAINGCLVESELSVLPISINLDDNSIFFPDTSGNIMEFDDKKEFKVKFEKDNVTEFYDDKENYHYIINVRTDLLLNALQGMIRSSKLDIKAKIIPSSQLEKSSIKIIGSLMNKIRKNVNKI